MTTTPAEAAARWRAAISGACRPMSDEQLEKVLADYKRWYVDGTFNLEQLERSAARALRLYHESRL